MKALPLENFLPAKMLILDDSAFDRARIRCVINVAHIRCLILEVDSLAALDEVLGCETFDIANLDFDLPDGTGQDALRRIRACERNSQSVSVMVTGNDTPHIARGALRFGCSSCLLKSDLSPDVLKQTITAGLRNFWTGCELAQQNQVSAPALTAFTVD